VVRIYAVILAGGSGSRLWPLSREQFPKQYLTLPGSTESLFQQTAARIGRLLPAELIYVVTNQDQTLEIRRQLAEMSMAGITILSEPEPRNTAPAIGLAAWRLYREHGPEEVMAVLPADHLVTEIEQFTSLLQLGEIAAQKQGMVAFGIRPLYPETGYGYILSGAELSAGIYRVEKFVEKPNLKEAGRYCADPRYYWNSGIFMFKVGALIEQYRRFLPAVSTVLDHLPASADSLAAFPYSGLEPVSIDYGIMEKAEHTALIPAEIGWSDLGSWDAYYQASPKDAAGNCLLGQVLAMDSTGSLVMARSRLVAALGVDNMVIIDTDDALLVCHRDKSQAVKQIYEQLKKNNSAEALYHRTVIRPWGSYTVLDKGESRQVKRITVMPGARLSLQSHRYRSEHWVVVSGSALVTLNDDQIPLKKGESIFIPIQTKHRLHNCGTEILEVIEVQNGSYLGEDDIIRYEDDFGRPAKNKAEQQYQHWLGQGALDEVTRGELLAMKGDQARISDHFGEELLFGTGGIRGIIGPGINRMNRYIIRRAAQGLAEYINALKPAPAFKRVAIAFDTRLYSPEFAREAAQVLAANGVQVKLFKEGRPTPELSFAVRELKCAAGIVITASHNPPQYNGFKIYGPDGGQAVSPLIERLVETVAAVDLFHGVQSMDFEYALSAGLIEFIGPEIDCAYLQAVRSQSQSRPAGRVKVVFTPLHGTGASLIPFLLKKEAHVDLVVVEQQMTADPQFSTVRVPNPEDPATFKLAYDLASEVNADLIIATDPDADRMGCVVRDASGKLVHLNGNQIGVLLIEYILSRMSEEGRLPANGVVITTVVTGDLGRKVARFYGVKTEETLTGFKYIGDKIKEYEQSSRFRFLFGYEESHGYLAGTHARDKDAVVSAFLFAEMAAYYRDKGLTLPDLLEQLYRRHGYFLDELVSLELKSKSEADGFIAAFAAAPSEIGGIRVVERRDYERRQALNLLTGAEWDLLLPRSRVFWYLMEDGAWFSVRPSGTEPKLKIYFSVHGADKRQAEEKMNRFKEAVLAIPARNQGGKAGRQV
jgi:phosphoglucomutase